jgi:hypothetical protein
MKMARVHTRHTANSEPKSIENHMMSMSVHLYVLDVDVETVHLDDVAVGVTVREGKSGDDAYAGLCYEGAKSHDRNSKYVLTLAPLRAPPLQQPVQEKTQEPSVSEPIGLMRWEQTRWFTESAAPARSCKRPRQVITQVQ